MIIAGVVIVIVAVVVIALFVLGGGSGNNEKNNIDVPSEFTSDPSNDLDGNGSVNVTDYAMYELKEWSNGKYLNQDDLFKFLDQIIDPDDPEGSMARAEKVLFVSSDKSTLTKSLDLVNKYGKTIASQAKISILGNIEWLFSSNYVTPETAEWYKDGDTSKDTFTFKKTSGRTVSTDQETMFAYLNLTLAIRCLAYVEAAVQYGVMQAKIMYDSYLNPPLPNNGGQESGGGFKSF